MGSGKGVRVGGAAQVIDATAFDLIGLEPAPYPSDGLWLCRDGYSFGVGRTEDAARAQWRFMEAVRMRGDWARASSVLGSRRSHHV